MACSCGANFQFWPSTQRPGRGCLDRHPSARMVSVNGDEMSAVVFIVLTVAIFAVLGVVQKLVEGL